MKYETAIEKARIEQLRQTLPKGWVIRRQTREERIQELRDELRTLESTDLPTASESDLQSDCGSVTSTETAPESPK